MDELTIKATFDEVYSHAPSTLKRDGGQTVDEFVTMSSGQLEKYTDLAALMSVYLSAEDENLKESLRVLVDEEIALCVKTNELYSVEMGKALSDARQKGLKSV